MPTLKRYGGDTIPAGATATLDGNYPVTVQDIIPPGDGDDPGAVQVRYSWGEVATVDPVRLGAYIEI